MSAAAVFNGSLARSPTYLVAGTRLRFFFVARHSQGGTGS